LRATIDCLADYFVRRSPEGCFLIGADDRPEVFHVGFVGAHGVFQIDLISASAKEGLTTELLARGAVTVAGLRTLEDMLTIAEGIWGSQRVAVARKDVERLRPKDWREQWKAILRGEEL